MTIEAIEVTMTGKQEIEKLAYQLWEQEGKPEGRALHHYFTAERMLHQQQTRLPSSPTPNKGGSGPVGRSRRLRSSQQPR